MAELIMAVIGGAMMEDGSDISGSGGYSPLSWLLRASEKSIALGEALGRRGPDAPSSRGEHSVLRLTRGEDDRLAGAGGVIGKIADVPGRGSRPVSGLTLEVPLVVLGKRGLVLWPVVLAHDASSFSRSSWGRGLPLPLLEQLRDLDLL
ncbi:hypothetical protein, partial [Archangium sp.]|uniref:hypothetical protein n=1 Tax=Archangium sp. TaxID=1872627 RepID=UPI002D5FB31B